MRLLLLPTSLATKDNKKKWLILELLRFRDFVRGLATIKTLLSIGVFLLLTSWLGLGVLGLVVAVVGMVILDYSFELISFILLKDFYLELPEAVFEVETPVEHDFRILMNRVENYIKNKDETRKIDLYKSLEECYSGMRFKTDLKEACDDLAKGNVQEKAQG